MRIKNSPPRRRGRIADGLVAALCLAGLLSACSGGGSQGGHPPAVLKVASQKGGVKALMQASHVLDGAPYSVEWSEFPAAQPLLEALSAGAVDLGAVGDAPFLFAYANDPKLRVVQVYRSGSGGHAVALVVPAQSPIRTPADLKGRRVATGKGSVGHYLLLRLLEQAHIKPSDVHVIFLSPGDAKAAMGGGSVDAWATWGAYIGLETLHGGGRVVADGAGLMNGYGFQASIAPSIAAKAPLIADFLHRLAVAQRWEQGHIGEYAKVLAKETGLPEDVAFETVRLQHPESVAITPQVIAEERDTLGHFAAAGVIPAPPPTDGAFDPQFNASVKP